MGETRRDAVGEEGGFLGILRDVGGESFEDVGLTPSDVRLVWILANARHPTYSEQSGNICTILLAFE